MKQNHLMMLQKAISSTFDVKLIDLFSGNRKFSGKLDFTVLQTFKVIILYTEWNYRIHFMIRVIYFIYFCYERLRNLRQRSEFKSNCIVYTIFIILILGIRSVSNENVSTYRTASLCLIFKWQSRQNVYRLQYWRIWKDTLRVHTRIFFVGGNIWIKTKQMNYY